MNRIDFTRLKARLARSPDAPVVREELHELVRYVESLHARIDQLVQKADWLKNLLNKHSREAHAEDHGLGKKKD